MFIDANGEGIKILFANSFKIPHRYAKEVKPFLLSVMQRLNSIGYSALFDYSSKRMAGNPDKTHKIYGNIKGHRLHFVYASQLEAFKNDTEYQNTIIFVKYTDSHDKQYADSMSVKTSEMTKSNVKPLLLDEFVVEYDETDELSNYKIGKTYKFNGYGSMLQLLPNLDAEQQKCLSLTNSSVVLRGVAGSGKTSICHELLKQLIAKGIKGLYVTFSNSLVNKAVGERLIFENNVQQCIEQISRNEVISIYDYVTKTLNIPFSATEKAEAIRELSNVLSNVSKVKIKSFDDLSKIDRLRASIEDFVHFITKENCLNDYKLKKQLLDTRLSFEHVYKEVYGVICGYLGDNYERADKRTFEPLMDKQSYMSCKCSAYSTYERDIFYRLAVKYVNYLNAVNKTDGNLTAVKLLNALDGKKEYEFIIIDETQDLSELQILYLSRISDYVFSAGDNNQMVNPSYFDFNRLKRITGATETQDRELRVNYRSTPKIVGVLNGISEIKNRLLGRWSSLDSYDKMTDDGEDTNLIYTDNETIITRLFELPIDNYVIIVADGKAKDAFVKKYKLREDNRVRTVAEAKGLEYDFVVIYNVLTAERASWEQLSNINKKQADINSRHRYIFNLMYVALTRSCHSICVIETQQNRYFAKLFQEQFTPFDQSLTNEQLTYAFSLRRFSETEWRDKYEVALLDGRYEEAMSIAYHYLNDPNLIMRTNVYLELNKNGDFVAAADKLMELGFFADAEIIYARAENKEQAALAGELAIYSLDGINDVVSLYLNTKSETLRNYLLDKYFLGKVKSISTESDAIYEKLRKLK